MTWVFSNDIISINLSNVCAFDKFDSKDVKKKPLWQIRFLTGAHTIHVPFKTKAERDANFDKLKTLVANRG